jgi:post-segregation antitoxin (ccd killing protein)
MPRGKPTKQTITVRVDPELVAEFRAVGGKNFSAAIDEGIRLWIARERRWQKEGKPSTARGAGGRPSQSRRGPPKAKPSPVPCSSTWPA